MCEPERDCPGPDPAGGCAPSRTGPCVDRDRPDHRPRPELGEHLEAPARRVRPCPRRTPPDSRSTHTTIASLTWDYTTASTPHSGMTWSSPPGGMPPCRHPDRRRLPAVREIAVAALRGRRSLHRQRRQAPDRSDLVGHRRIPVAADDYGPTAALAMAGRVVPGRLEPPAASNPAEALGIPDPSTLISRPFRPHGGGSSAWSRRFRPRSRRPGRASEPRTRQRRQRPTDRSGGRTARAR